jgi:alpha-L-fucosidase
MAHRLILHVVLFCVLAVSAFAQVAPPAPLEPVPTARQLAWHALEYYGFLHFTVNTFTDKEWGYGDEGEEVFNPSALDVTQWVNVAKEAGMKGLIITAKHHDGFCLWPSAYTEHSIKNSPYLDGKGDIVGALSAACADAGLQFGVYLSPWDRNHAEYGRPAYIEYFRNQLTELLTNYGPTFEVWFDGANGGDGYYGGARETRTIDRTTYYDWDTTWKMVRDMQPNAAMFSDIGPDIRWVGNEQGFAGDPCWSTFTPKPRDGQGPAPGMSMYEEAVNGHADGKFWLPAEVDVSIRPGWFYHPKEDDKVRTPENLLKIYYESVGRGTTLLLNVPPDRRGLIHENDAAALRGLRAILDQTFTVNLAEGAAAVADRVRGNAEQFSASNLVDDDRTTYWATDDGDTEATIEITLPESTTFDHVVLQEYIELGQRILRFSVHARKGDSWERIAEGTSIGWKRILPIEPVTTDAIQVHIEEARACPTLSTVSLHARAH